MKVVLLYPTLTRPYPQFVDALEASVPALDAAGIEHKASVEVGCPYISAARANLLRRALDTEPDCVVFLDHDVSWRPEDLVKLIQTEGDVVGGTYRFKTPDEVKYMGFVHTDEAGYPDVRESDGAIRACRLPAGFLKVTKKAVQDFMRAYPELVFGDPIKPAVDLFNHGAFEGVWWGEDYAFCRRWQAMGRDLWLVPDLDITHHDHTLGDFPGNYHKFLLAPEPDDIKEAA